VEERVFALASGDVFGQARGEPADAGHFWICLGFEVGVARILVLDGAVAERGATEAVTDGELGNCFPTHFAMKMRIGWATQLHSNPQ
jgi:hypothetical protein